MCDTMTTIMSFDGHYEYHIGTIDGSVRLVMPAKAAPDSIGYNLNQAFQIEKKTKAVARLRAKLAAKKAMNK